MSKSATSSALAGRKLGAKPSRAKALLVSRSASATMNFKSMYQADAMDRIHWIKQGVPARTVEDLAKRMAMSKERLMMTLGLGRATINRKARENRSLSNDEGSRVLGMARLVGQVQAMVEESGNPAGFNAAEWVARWLDRPLPALDGMKPAELMDTAEGQSLISALMDRMQTGAYA